MRTVGGVEKVLPGPGPPLRRRVSVVYPEAVDLERLRRFSFLPGATPVAIDRAEGAYLFTTDGRRILDAAGGAIVANIGHGRREVAEAAAEAATRATYLVPPFATEARLRLVERLLDRWLPDGLCRVFLASGGSEAMDAAIRIARQHQIACGREGRYKVVGRDLSYHGTTVGTLAVGGHAKRRADFAPLLSPHPKAPACYCLRCPLERTYPECGVACALELERVIEREGADTIAAFVAEPIGGSGAGALVPPDEYWPRVSEICRRHDILLISDEVMTGFGRTGRRFAVEHWGLASDLLVSGKGLSGGYAPICGVFAREEVVRPIAERGLDVMFYTYGGHPAACAAADRVLDILERESLVARAAELGDRLSKRLEELREHPNVADVRGRGLLWAIELVEDRETLRPFPADARLTQKVVASGLSQGVFFYPGGTGTAQDIVVLGPPFIVDEPELDLIAQVLPRAIDEAVERVRSR